MTSATESTSVEPAHNDYDRETKSHAPIISKRDNDDILENVHIQPLKVESHKEVEEGDSAVQHDPSHDLIQQDQDNNSEEDHGHDQIQKDRQEEITTTAAETAQKVRCIFQIICGFQEKSQN